MYDKAYRDMKLAVVQQEAAIYTAVHGSGERPFAASAFAASLLSSTMTSLNESILKSAASSLDPGGTPARCISTPQLAQPAHPDNYMAPAGVVTNYLQTSATEATGGLQTATLTEKERKRAEKKAKKRAMKEEESPEERDVRRAAKKARKAEKKRLMEEMNLDNSLTKGITKERASTNKRHRASSLAEDERVRADNEPKKQTEEREPKRIKLQTDSTDGSTFKKLPEDHNDEDRNQTRESNRLDTPKPITGSLGDSNTSDAKGFKITPSIASAGHSSVITPVYQSNPNIHHALPASTAHRSPSVNVEEALLRPSAINAYQALSPHRETSDLPCLGGEDLQDNPDDNVEAAPAIDNHLDGSEDINVTPEDKYDPYGLLVRIPQPLSGYYATCYYPERTIPFVIPNGELSENARRERYRDLTDKQIAEREAAYEDLSKQCPLVFQNVFKHTARARLDRMARFWLVPRIQNYYFTPTECRKALLNRIVRDMFHEFPDLHPNFLKLKNATEERKYLIAVWNVVSHAACSLKSTLENPTKIDNIDKDIVRHLMGTAGPVRPHDLWARSLTDRPGGEASQDIEPGDRPEDGDGPNVLAEWDAMFEEVKAQHGDKYASRNRLKLEQDFRKDKFSKLSEEEQKIWADLAANSDRLVDSTTALATGLPLVNLMLKRFAGIAEVPMVVILGAPDLQNPGKVLVYHDTYSSGPSQVPDFFDGPDRFGENVILPAFRRYLAQYYGASQNDVANQGIPLPLPSQDVPDPGPLDPERIREERSSELPGLTLSSGVSFTVTPPPMDWTTESKELDTIKRNVKLFIADSYKQAHKKQRCHFGTLVSHAAELIDLSLLPTTKTVAICDTNRAVTYKEGDIAHIVYPVDPTSMPWYHVKAYYDLFKDPASRFRWRKESPSAHADLGNPPASVQVALSEPSADTAANAAGRTKGKSKPDNGNPSKHKKPMPAPPTTLPTKTAPQSKRSPAADEEEEAVFSDRSTDSGGFSVGSESSAGEDYSPDQLYILRDKTTTRTGRRSVPPALTRMDQGSEPFFNLKPVEDPETAVSPSQIDGALEHLRGLSLPTSLRNNTHPVPNLQAVIKHSAKLDSLFPARELTLPLMLKSSSDDPGSGDILALFWADINNSGKPVPTCLAATQLALNAGIKIESLARTVEDALVEFVDVLEGHDMLDGKPHGLPQPVSWTSSLVLLARYLKFVQSIRTMEPDVQNEQTYATHDRVLELAIIHVVVRYCVGTMTAYIAPFPAPSSAPALANTVSSLGSSWLRMVGRVCSPLKKIWGANWAHTVDPSQQLIQNQPFFHLAVPNKRWIQLKPTRLLYECILDLEKDLHSNPTLFESMPIYDSFTCLASLFAIHESRNIRGGDDLWLGIVDKVLEVIEMAHCGGSRPDAEQTPKQPPPTLAAESETAPQRSKYQLPRSSKSREKTAWQVGDIARVMIGGEEEDVIFVKKQKYGLNAPCYLVMADPKTIKEIFAADGETELPLPPFSPSRLISKGPTDLIELSRLRVVGHWDLPHLTFEDFNRPEMAGYVAQFKNLPLDNDDDPNELEKLGFKPPQYFIKKYREAQEHPSSMMTRSDHLKIADRNPATAETCPQEPIPGDGSSTTDVMHAASKDSSEGAGSEYPASNSGGSASQVPMPDQPLSATNPSSTPSQGLKQVDTVDKSSHIAVGTVSAGIMTESYDAYERPPVEREENEEEEVENVLGPEAQQSSRVTRSKTAPAAKTKSKTTSSVQAKKHTPAVTRKKKDYGLPSRSSSRLQQHAPSGILPMIDAAPTSQLNRRTSTRSKPAASNPEALDNGGGRTRRR
ncbi:hypothetical protein FRB90_000703 [Tulasnella sp. 427]|nr:hypothetical protein FRB90_000703 [Tulasnella sp. 427]